MNYLLLLALFVPAHAAVTLYEEMSVFSKEYRLPDLPYKHEALEPYIDAATVFVHHTGHHHAYTNKMNAALASWRNESCMEDGSPRICRESIVTILGALDKIPPAYRQTLQNNGGGYVNHNLYWWGMRPNTEGREREPQGPLADDLDRDFGGFSKFKDAFTQQALTLFGSGYVWLSRQPDDQRLVLSTSANQDSPLSQGLRPILVLDVWEHAYYLKHQNKRAKHVADWWMLVDWQAVSALDQFWAGMTQHDEL